MDLVEEDTQSAGKKGTKGKKEKKGATKKSGWFDWQYYCFLNDDQLVKLKELISVSIVFLYFDFRIFGFDPDKLINVLIKLFELLFVFLSFLFAHVGRSDCYQLFYWFLFHFCDLYFFWRTLRGELQVCDVLPKLENLASFLFTFNFKRTKRTFISAFPISL